MLGGCHELASTRIGNRRRRLNAWTVWMELTSLVQCSLLAFLVVSAQVEPWLSFNSYLLRFLFRVFPH